VLADNMIKTLAPMRARASELKKDPEGVQARLRSGAAKASDLAQRTIADVRDNMGFLKP
jgi:tryptophanyl-tRNA synthetase